MPTVNSKGIDIYYEVHGDKSKPPILFCNGYPPPLEHLVKFYFPSFLDRFCCAAYDIRGIGGSAEPEEDSEFSILRLAEDGLAVMDDLGWDSAHIWGVSMGAVFGARLEVLAPKRVRSLLLAGFDSGAPNAFQQKYAETVRNRHMYIRETAQPGLTPEEIAHKMISFYGPVDTPRAAEMIEYFASFIRSQPKRPRDWSLMKKLFPPAPDLDKYISELPEEAEPSPLLSDIILDHLPKIQAKTLIVHGYHDPLIHRDFALQGMEHIKNAEIRLSKASKHSFSLAPEVLVDQADWIARREAEFSSK